MNINDLTIGEAKELANLFNSKIDNNQPNGLSSLIGRKVIIRTYSAGVHYGKLIEKAGTEVIIEKARRLWYWKTKNGGISISEIANQGLDSSSKVCEEVELQWLDAIEIIPCTESAIENIEGQDVFKK